MVTWIDGAEHALTGDSLALLLDNKIPAIRVKAFASPAECVAFSAAVKTGRMQYYNVAERIGYICLAQYQIGGARPGKSSWPMCPRPRRTWRRCFRPLTSTLCSA